jgi:hypothetical protein
MDVPAADLPAGSIPSDQHPMWCSIGRMNAIRQVILGITSLSQSSCYIPYVDCTGKGDPCNYPIFTALGGQNGQIAPGVIPGELSSFPLSLRFSRKKTC